MKWVDFQEAIEKQSDVRKRVNAALCNTKGVNWRPEEVIWRKGWSFSIGGKKAARSKRRELIERYTAMCRGRFLVVGFNIWMFELASDAALFKLSEPEVRHG